ncbi:Pericentriolar material 1 protein [Heterocephalus glaber]|uniref:Pericentriolar material 1 protein n=1 Tax=Heterocephalus glaber TaxID=10181 RepID=G5ASH5_HETGA|nr:Pericentriolar material 1 protein [Heterocephalus glaber]
MVSKETEADLSFFISPLYRPAGKRPKVGLPHGVYIGLSSSGFWHYSDTVWYNMTNIIYSALRREYTGLSVMDMVLTNHFLVLLTSLGLFVSGDLRYPSAKDLKLSRAEFCGFERASSCFYSKEPFLEWLSCLPHVFDDVKNTLPSEITFLIDQEHNTGIYLFYDQVWLSMDGGNTFKLIADFHGDIIKKIYHCFYTSDVTFVSQSGKVYLTKADHSSPAREIDDEGKDKDETKTVKQTQTSEVYGAEGPKNVRSDVSDQEEDESDGCPVSINLSKTEIQALTNYGSGEDENEDEEIEEFKESPVDVQTSLQANTETIEENEHDDQVLQHELEKTAENTKIPSEQEHISEDDQDSSPMKSCYLNILENEQPLISAAHKDSLTTVDSSQQPNPLPLPLTEIETLVPRVKEVKSAQETPESSRAGSPDTESPVLVNDYEEESGNISQKSDEEDFVKVEDLPLKLTIYSEADLRRKMVEEEQKNHLSGEICEMQTEELAGNAQTLKEPGKQSRIPCGESFTEPKSCPYE